MIDLDGFRPNVGIVVCNKRGQVLWARRVGRSIWQFPQGGIKYNETPENALYRELYEELGLRPAHVEILGSTKRWLRYFLPKRFVRKNTNRICIGQKQIWFLLRLISDEKNVNLECFDQPEFEDWQWVNYWHPVNEVIYFKRTVYQLALSELEQYLQESAVTP